MANHYLNTVTACPLKGTIKSISVALANRANDHGVCWPSVKTISADTGFHISTVKRAIQSLKNSGHIKVDARSRKDGSQTSNRYTLIIEAFTTGVKESIKRGFIKAVDMGKQFIESKVQVIRPTSSKFGEQAWLELPESDQKTVIDRVTSKTNPVLKSQIDNYALDSAYVQKALFNEVQQLKRERSSRQHRTTIEKLTDRSWDLEPSEAVEV